MSLLSSNICQTALVFSYHVLGYLCAACAGEGQPRTGCRLRGRADLDHTLSPWLQTGRGLYLHPLAGACPPWAGRVSDGRAPCECPSCCYSFCKRAVGELMVILVAVSFGCISWCRAGCAGLLADVAAPAGASCSWPRRSPSAGSASIPSSCCPRSCDLPKLQYYDRCCQSCSEKSNILIKSASRPLNRNSLIWGRFLLAGVLLVLHIPNQKRCTATRSHRSLWSWLSHRGAGLPCQPSLGQGGACLSCQTSF